MIIGIDASRANREHKSGTEWYSYHLIKNLAQIDSQNEYILYTDTPLKGGLLDLTRFELEEENYKNEEVKFDDQGFQIIKSPYNNFKAKVLNWPFSFFWTLGRLSLEMLFRKPDVLFVPAHGLPFIHPKRTITTIHDVAFEKSKELYRQESLGSSSKIGRKIVNFIIRILTFNKYGAYSVDYLRWSTRFALKRAQKIIAVSNSTKQDILDTYKCEADKLKVIYNAFDKNTYHSVRDQDKEQEILEKYELNKPYFLYVGRVEKKKNIPLLIEAFAAAQYGDDGFDQNLVLVGDAGYGYDEVMYTIKEYDLDGCIFRPGWVEEADMPYIFSAATAFVFPSRSEGFGIPILQAFACETPVLASCITPFQEVAKDAALFFNPIEKQEISDAMIRINKDGGLREKLVQKGKQRAKQFSWKKTAEQTLREIESM